VWPTTPDELCNHTDTEELTHIPHVSTQITEALNFLGKDKDGFFLLYEQGDVSSFAFFVVYSLLFLIFILLSSFSFKIDLAAHKNHMDNMLGSLLDMSDSVEAIIDR